MSKRVDPDFKRRLFKYGGSKEWNECFHCGNCTAVCPLTEQGFLFPRKSIRDIQMGLKDNLLSYTDPWLCYYCGECSETCPRNANPGELMMTLRRYLTSMYDITGLSHRFYTSKWWEFGYIAIIFVMIILAFLIFLPLRPDAAAMINDSGGVMINNLVAGMSPETFVRIIELGDWTMAVIVASLLIMNIIHMFKVTILNDSSTKVPFVSYFSEFRQLFLHFLTQAKFSKCEDKKYWVGHFLLMTGYSIMFALIVAVLPKFQIEDIVPWYNWQRLLGYYATIGILFFLVNVAIGRIRKIDIKLRFSHSTDWLFIIMLGLTTISGILVHIFRITGLPVLTYYSYVAHMAILVPMVLVEVPFSKWSHLAYRPFAIYFTRLKKAAVARQFEPELAPTL
jgi:ferredoxin